MRYFAFLWLLLCTAAQAEQTIDTTIDDDWLYADYAIHGDGTVTDTRTGLMWQRCALGLSGEDCATGTATTHTWQEALEQAQSSTVAGHSDWLLSNMKEQRSLVALNRTSPAINSEVFPNTEAGVFLSSTPRFLFGSDEVWGMSFDLGSNFTGKRSTAFYVRLVRTSE